MPGDKENGFPFVTRKMLAFETGTAFQLVLNVVAQSANAIEVRGMTKEGPFTFRLTPVGDDSMETFTLNVADIPISVSVAFDNAIDDNRIAHATLYLAVNGNRMAILAQGMINGLWGIAWPHNPITGYLQTHGLPEAVEITAPATGSEISFDVPFNQTWELLGMSFIFTADANAANRVVALSLGGSNAPMIVRKSATNITANQSVILRCLPGGTTASITAATEQEIGLPPKIFLPPGTTVSTSTASMQVGDAYTNVEFFIKRHFGRKS